MKAVTQSSASTQTPVMKLLESLHGKARKHPGTSKLLLQETRRKKYLPGVAKKSMNG